MRNLKHWIGAALLAQPFYAEEIQMIGRLAQTWRFGLRHLRRDAIERGKLVTSRAAGPR